MLGLEYHLSDQVKGKVCEVTPAYAGAYIVIGEGHAVGTFLLCTCK